MRYYHIFLSLCLLLLSCTSQDDTLVPQAPELVPLEVSLSGFDITTAPLTRATTDVPAHLNRLSLTVFNAQGEAVASVGQKRESLASAVLSGGVALGATPVFGQYSLTLATGTYTFVCVLHEAKAATDDALAAIAPVTIISATEAQLTPRYVYDTYTCSQQVTVDAGTTSVTLDMGTRRNTRFHLTLTDAVPTTVKSVAIRINPGQTAAAAPLTFSPATGLTTTALTFSGSKSTTGVDLVDLSMDFLLPTSPLITSVVIEGRDGTTSSANVLFTRTLTDVTFLPNQETHATGRLFTGTLSTAFSLSTDWLSPLDISF